MTDSSGGLVVAQTGLNASLYSGLNAQKLQVDGIWLGLYRPLQRPKKVKTFQVADFKGKQLS